MAPRGYVRVVGESHYQEVLKSLLATARSNRIVTVGVEPEPDNPFDSKAIRVFDPATGKTLGYLPRGTTGFVRLLKDHGIWCNAELKGGTSDKPSIGLVLHLHGEQEDEVHRPPLQPPGLAPALKSAGGLWAFIRRFRKGR
jgi:hypothetical protein